MMTDIGFSLRLKRGARAMARCDEKEFVALYDRYINKVTDELMLFIKTFDLVPKKKRLCAVALGFGCSNCVEEIKANDIRKSVYNWLAYALKVSVHNYVLFSESDPVDYWGTVSVCDTYLENLKFVLKQNHVDDNTEYVLTICELKK